MGKCLFKDIPYGDYSNQVSVRMPDSWVTEKQTRDICVDACMVPELLYLWNKGIRTIASCCGHGRHKSIIVVDEAHSEHMEKMSYRHANCYPGRNDIFYGITHI